jgi:hypothetical protein
MESRVLSLDDILRERQRWCVPVYQRHYAWDIGEDGQLTRLWEDLEEKANDFVAGGSFFPHYIGAIIVAEPPNQPFGTVRQRLLVDGQQRITTFQLVLAAIREVARGRKNDSLISVINTYLFNEVGGGMIQPNIEKYKLWPSTFDRQLYRNIADQPADKLPALYGEFFYKNGNLKAGSAPRLLAAYWYLLKRIGDFLDDNGAGDGAPHQRLEAVLSGFLKGFRVVVIQLDDKDDAQEIFASLNGLGKPLKAIDLIRNDVFYRARRAGEDDETIFEEGWRTFEDPFWNVMTRQGRFHRARIDFFLAHMLVAETAKEVNLGKLAAEYQNYARKRQFDSVAAEIDNMIRYVPTYRVLVQPGQPNIADNIGRFLNIWDLTTFYPLVFHISVQAIDDEEKLGLFDLLKAYIVRRELCGLTSKNYNNVVVRCLGHLRQHGTTAANLLELFRQMEGDAVRFPPDIEVVQRSSQRRVYGDIPTPRLRFILEAIEQRKRTKFDDSVMATVAPQVEHVMPQKWSENWPLPDGRTAPCESAILAITAHKVDAPMQEQIAIREGLVDSIGNLTLVTSPLNPSLGNASFADKKAQLAKSLLVLNREIADHNEWNEETIRARGIELATLATQIWVPKSASSP